MVEYILQENVLSDNTITVPDHDKIFKGGYVGILKEYTFNTAWTDKMTVKRFKKWEVMEKYLAKHYPEFEF